ncbi:unnamed protein product, partial [Prorocentrum cordatum]
GRSGLRAVGADALRLAAGTWAAEVLLPPQARALPGGAARFSRRRRQLTLSWPAAAAPLSVAPAAVAAGGGPAAAGCAPLPALAAAAAAVAVVAPVAAAVVAPVAAAPVAAAAASAPAQAAAAAPWEAAPPAAGAAEGVTAPVATATPAAGPAVGSLWNVNNWHWEERNAIEPARAAVAAALARLEQQRFRHVPSLGGASVLLREIGVTGHATASVRKGKRILLYELVVSFEWESQDEFGHRMAAKGSGVVREVTRDDEVAVAEIKASVGARDPDSKAIAAWMQGRGAEAVAAALGCAELAEAIAAAVAASAPSATEDAARRTTERLAADGARAEQGEKQRAIAAEQKAREEAARLAGRAQGGAGLQAGASVWNANAWHWEEKPMTQWAQGWLRERLLGLTVRLLDGAVSAHFTDASVSGDASVSIRKGQVVSLFQLSIQGRWSACLAGAQGSLGAAGTKAEGELAVPEFTSEEAERSSVAVKAKVISLSPGAEIAVASVRMAHKRMAFTDADTGDEVSLEDVLDRYAEKQATKQKEVFQEMLDEKLESLVESKIASRLQPLIDRLERFEKSAAVRASSAPPAPSVPAFLEIKGFVDNFESAAASGITPDEAKVLVAKLKGVTPEDRCEHVGEAETREGGRNFAVKVYVSQSINKVFSLWKAQLRREENEWKGRELFAAIEKSPKQKLKYDAMGKVKRMLEKEVATNLPNYKVRIFWGWDMCAYLEPQGASMGQQGQASVAFIAHVEEDGAIEWDPEGLRVLGCPNTDAARLKVMAASIRGRNAEAPRRLRGLLLIWRIDGTGDELRNVSEVALLTWLWRGTVLMFIPCAVLHDLLDLHHLREKWRKFMVFGFEENHSTEQICIGLQLLVQCGGFGSDGHCVAWQRYDQQVPVRAFYQAMAQDFTDILVSMSMQWKPASLQYLNTCRGTGPSHVSRFELVGDSMLIVNWINGLWRCKYPVYDARQHSALLLLLLQLVAGRRCCRSLLLVGAAAGRLSRLSVQLVGGRCCCWSTLLLQPVAGRCCCWSVLLVGASAGRQWSLQSVLLVGGRCRCLSVLLLQRVAGRCLCWSVLLVCVAVGRWSWWSALLVGGGGCCWSVLLLRLARAFRAEGVAAVRAVLADFCAELQRLPVGISAGHFQGVPARRGEAGREHRARRAALERVSFDVIFPVRALFGSKKKTLQAAIRVDCVAELQRRAVAHAALALMDEDDASSADSDLSLRAPVDAEDSDHEDSGVATDEYCASLFESSASRLARQLLAQLRQEFHLHLFCPH